MDRASYTWVIDNQTKAVGGITPYSGVDPSQPIDAYASNTGFSSTATTAATTTSSTNEEVIALFATNVGKSFSAPSGVSVKYNLQHDSTGPSTAAFDTLQVAAGSTGSIASQIDNSKARYWSSQVIALRKPPLHPVVNGTVTSHAVNDNSTSTTFDHTVNPGPNQMLIITVGEAGSEETSVTYDNIPMIRGDHGSGSEENYAYWYLMNPAYRHPPYCD